MTTIKKYSLIFLFKIILRYLSIFLLVALALFFLIMGYWGYSSIVLTAIVYITCWATLRTLLNYSLSHTPQRTNLNVLLTSTMLSLFVAELVVKYIIKIEGEREPEYGFTPYPYGSPPLENLYYKYVIKHKDLRLRNAAANENVTDKQQEFVYHYKYNSLGFQGNDFSTDSQLFNIIGLGDSFTEGCGAPADSTWLNLFAQQANNTALFPRQVQPINGGIHGSDPFFEFVMLRELLLVYNPKIVVLAINKTDVYDVIKNGGWERFSADNKLQARPRPWWYILYQCSPIARYIIYIGRNWLLLTPEEYKKEEDLALQKIIACVLNDYKPLADSCRFKLVVFAHPMLEELTDDNFVLQQMVDSLETSKDIITINAYTEFKRLHEHHGLTYNSIYWPIDGHHKSEGYKLWANILYHELRKPEHQLAIVLPDSTKH